jgi:hypothetical protein
MVFSALNGLGREIFCLRQQANAPQRIRVYPLSTLIPLIWDQSKPSVCRDDSFPHFGEGREWAKSFRTR